MKYVKIKPDEVDQDQKYQRTLDQGRVDAIVESIDLERIGVPVVSQRPGKRYVAIDGQHRIKALLGAGLGDQPMMMEVHEGLSLEQEARLFLQLNGGRKVVGALDKFKARLIARDPVALEIKSIVSSFKLTIGAGAGARRLSAIDAIESVHRRLGNLKQVMSVLAQWADGDPAAYNGQIIRGVGVFLHRFTDAKAMIMTRQLDGWAPDRVISKIKRLTGNATPAVDAYCDVFFEIYNHRLKRSEKLQMPTVLRQAAEA